MDKTRAVFSVLFILVEPNSSVVIFGFFPPLFYSIVDELFMLYNSN